MRPANERPDPVAQVLPGGMLLLGPVGALLVARALSTAVRVERVNGDGRPSEAALRLLAAAEFAAEAARGAATAGQTSDNSGNAYFRNGSPRSSLQPVVGATAGFVGTREAAARLRVTDRQVRNLAARGVLASRRAGRRWLVNEADVAARVLDKQDR